MGIRQRKEKSCLNCEKTFSPSGNNTKRCPPCRRQNHLRKCKERRRRTYTKKGYNQAGPNNNSWKGGSSPAYYQRVCFGAHGKTCRRCGNHAVLVHHRNEDRSDNGPDNLEPMCKRCHQILHGCTNNLPKHPTFKDKSCTECAARFSPTGPRSKYCSRCRAEAKV